MFIIKSIFLFSRYYVLFFLKKITERKNRKSKVYTKSKSMTTWKFSLFQPWLFTSHLHNIFPSTALYYFKDGTRYKIKSYQSILLHFLVSKVERNNPSVKTLIESGVKCLRYEQPYRKKPWILRDVKRNSFNYRAQFKTGNEDKVQIYQQFWAEKYCRKT